MVLGIVKFIVEWLKDGKLVWKMSRFDIKIKGDIYMLKIKDVVLEDFGIYIFKVLSLVGILIKFFDVNV